MRRSGVLVGGVLIAVLGVTPAVAGERLVEVQAVAETAANWDDEAGGDANADDPAIWVRPDRPAAIVSPSAYGVAALQLGGQTIVAVTRRSEARIGLFRLVPDGHGKISYRPIRTLDFPKTFRLSDGKTWSPCEDPGDRPQFEGMVFDRTTATLYAAQEDVGIWRIPLAGRPDLVEKVREFGQPAQYDPETEECAPTGPAGPDAGKHLSADAEGAHDRLPARRTDSVRVESGRLDLRHVPDRPARPELPRRVPDQRRAGGGRRTAQ